MQDINHHHYLFRITPQKWHVFLRLMRADRPVGTWLLLLPCWWGLTFCRDELLPADFFIAFVLLAVGAVVMRGAGCVWNDYTDRHIDAMVARTKTRPIPNGDITPRNALIFMVFLLLVGLAILLYFPHPAIMLGLASVLLFIPYPFMKRIFGFPQLWLGFTFNWGLLLASSASGYYPDMMIILFYLNAVLWTLGYDTIYACQDKNDDALIGIGSSALSLGRYVKPAVFAFYFIFMANLFVLGLFYRFRVGYFVFLLLAFVYNMWLLRQFNPETPEKCLKIFQKNRELGLLVFLALFFH